MNTRTLLVSFVLAVAFVMAGASTVAAQEKYEVDPAHSNVLFRVKHMDVGYVYGWFLDVSGSFTYDKANPGKSSFQFTAKTDSIFTNNKKRDDHLKSDDFFNAKQFPEITFESKKVEAVTDTTLRITGDLTLHGETKEVVVLAEMTGTGEDGQGNFRRGFFASFDVKRSDFGIETMPKVVSERVHLVITSEGIRQ